MHTHASEFGTNFTMAILLGVGMFLLLETAVAYLNFGPWFRQPGLTPGPSPERFLRAAIHSFVMMVVVCGILTYFYSELDFSNTPLIDWFGYNNICIIFDSAPATYIAPVFWFFVAYLIVRFAVEDTKRLYRIPKLGAGAKAIAYTVNVALVIIAAFFSLCLAIGPEENMILHTAPFVALVLAFPLVYVMHYWQSVSRSPLFTGAVIAFLAISVIKASFTLFALFQGPGLTHISASIVQPVDGIWILFALLAPFLMPAPEAPEAHEALIA